MSVLLFPSVLFLDPANLTGNQTPPISSLTIFNRAFLCNKTRSTDSQDKSVCIITLDKLDTSS